MANYDAEILLFDGQAPILPTYYMRGYDNTLLDTVFWTATFLDSTGTQYTGPGPLTDIVWLRVI